MTVKRLDPISKVLAQNPSLTKGEAEAWLKMQAEASKPKPKCCPCRSPKRAEVVSHYGKRCICPVGVCECDCHGRSAE